MMSHQLVGLIVVAKDESKFCFTELQRIGEDGLKYWVNSPGDELIRRSTSEVAVCCSSALTSCFRASASSRVRALTCSCRSLRVELAGRAALAALLRLGPLGLRCCRFFAGFRPTVPCRLT